MLCRFRMRETPLGGLEVGETVKTEQPFEPARLRLARELMSWNQSELARRVGVTPAALSQFETGAARPSPQTLESLATHLQVPKRFFELPVLDTHEGFFRSLRRTAVADRRRARAVAFVAHDVATLASDESGPALTLPQFPTSSLEASTQEIERVAAQLRAAWKIRSGPVASVVELLESHGIVVIRLPLDSADVDAFSLPFSDRPVVVLGSDKNDRARSRFDAAHELGHLVMHGEHVWGLPEVERQGHSFAAAFLMPRDDIYNELPERADWPRLFDLKRKWQVSLAALLMRARTLGRMTENNYLTAVKGLSARGWRRVEPVPLGAPEEPTLLIATIRSDEYAVLRVSLPEHLLDSLANAAAA